VVVFFVVSFFVVSMVIDESFFVVSIFIDVSVVAAGAGAIAGVVVSFTSVLFSLEQAATASTAATRARRFIAIS
jgi:hypothetical protein